jgi:hypothetical protein
MLVKQGTITTQSIVNKHIAIPLIVVRRPNFNALPAAAGFIGFFFFFFFFQCFVIGWPVFRGRDLEFLINLLFELLII